MGAAGGTAGLRLRLRAWWAARDWRRLALGAPAVACAAGLAGLAAACLSGSPRELEARYLAEAKAAFQAGQYPRALTCYDRLAPAADGPDALYRLALTAEAAGDPARAAAIMRDLAPDAGRGYAPAHYWRARQYLAAPPDPRRVAAARDHLARALDGDLDDRDAVHGLLGSLYLADDRRLEDAEFHLGKAVATRPTFRLQLARAFARRGNLPRARQEAELAVRYFRDRAKADPSGVVPRLMWADAEAFLEDFPAAVGALEEGLAATGDPVYRQALGKAYAGWYDARKQRAGVPPGELLGLLDRGLARDPENRDLLNRLLELLRVGAPEADRARAALHDLLAKGGTAAGPIHFALAVDARLRGDRAAELVHLEQAFRLDPRTGAIANNLAWVLSQPPAPDLPRALTLVNVALEREPGNPTYLDTRGRIYLALGRWPDALADLGAVHAKAPDTPGLGDALAEAYERLGQADLAARYRAAKPAP